MSLFRCLMRGSLDMDDRVTIFQMMLEGDWRLPQNCVESFLNPWASYQLHPSSCSILQMMLEKGAQINLAAMSWALNGCSELFRLVISLPGMTCRGPHCLIDVLTFQSTPNDKKQAHENLKILIAHLRGLDFGEGLFGLDPITGKTPFCIGLRPGIFRLFIEEGGNINLRASEGCHPIFYMCESYIPLHDWGNLLSAWSSLGVELEQADVVKLSGIAQRTRSAPEFVQGVTKRFAAMMKKD